MRQVVLYIAKFVMEYFHESVTQRRVQGTRVTALLSKKKTKPLSVWMHIVVLLEHRFGVLIAEI